MGDQSFPACAARLIRPFPKEHILSRGERLGLNGSIQVVGLRVCMDAHSAEIRAELGFEILPECGWQRLALSARRIQLPIKGFAHRKHPVRRRLAWAHML